MSVLAVHCSSMRSRHKSCQCRVCWLVELPDEEDEEGEEKDED